MFLYHRIISDQIKLKKDLSTYEGQTKIHTSNKLLFLFLGEKVSSPLDCFSIMPAGLNSFYADIQYEGRGL